MARDTEHGRAITAQLTRRHGTLDEAIDAAVFALGAAGLSKSIRRQARAACEDYFYGRLDLTPSHELGGRGEIVESLELMPEPMYRALPAHRGRTRGVGRAVHCDAERHPALICRLPALLSRLVEFVIDGLYGRMLVDARTVLQE